MCWGKSRKRAHFIVDHWGGVKPRAIGLGFGGDDGLIITYAHTILAHDWIQKVLSAPVPSLSYRTDDDNASPPCPYERPLT